MIARTRHDECLAHEDCGRSPWPSPPLNSPSDAPRQCSTNLKLEDVGGRRDPLPLPTVDRDEQNGFGVTHARNTISAGAYQAGSASNAVRVLTTLREALDDPRLLGNALPGQSWHTWRTILLATMGEPLTDDELVTFQEVTGRETAPAKRCEELIAVIGRRGGKSRAVAVLAVYLSTLIDHQDVLVTGERGLLLCIAPDLRQAGIVHGYIQGIVAESELLAPLVDHATTALIKLSNGIDIETRAASWRRLRGVTCIAAIADESCFWFSDESSANRDSEILQAIRPALATTHGLMAVISTPYARRGATWESFHRDYGPKGDPEILVAAGPSRTFNPSLSQRVIDRAYDRDPVAAAAEYGGEWRSDITAFLSREAVTACVDCGVIERPARQGIVYHAFVDPSGGSNDSMTLGISHMEGGRALLDAIREVKPPFSPESVTREFCETLLGYRVKRVQGDRYGGLWPTEQFQKYGVKYEPTDKTASQIFLEALPLINAGSCGLLDHRRLLDQLIGLERRTSFGTGRDTVGHPPGAHDDVAVAACGSVLMATAKLPQTKVGFCIGVGPVKWRDDEERPRSSLHRNKDGDLVLKSWCV